MKQNSRWPEDEIEEVTQCPWCGSSRYSVWCRDEPPFLTVECQDCKIIYVKKRLNARGREKYYARYHSKIHQAEDLADKREKMYLLELNFIEEFCRGGRVLDVGCGGGKFLLHFHPDRWERWGVEIGAEAVREAKALIGGNIFEGELLDIDLPPHAFDLIVFRGVIEHVAEPKKTLLKALELLKPGGLSSSVRRPIGTRSVPRFTGKSGTSTLQKRTSFTFRRSISRAFSHNMGPI